MFGQNREQLRQMYVDTWAKFCSDQPLQPLEKQLADVIALHPEYHRLLEQSAEACGKDYLPESGETNPFLHMGLHMAIQEQLATDRPAGIRSLYQKMLSQFPDRHTLEHQIMECLTEMIWQSQRNNVIPDEKSYLQCVGKLSGQAE
ncbi:MAG: DUF1841 family protein [Gammaproteobacteria bacterium]